MLLKKSIIALSVFASTTLFAICTNTGFMALTQAEPTYNYATNAEREYKPFVSETTTFWFCDSPTFGTHTRRTTTTVSTGSYTNLINNTYYTAFITITDHLFHNVSSCSIGYYPTPDGVCTLPDLSTYNGNRTACHDHGGWYLEDICTDKAGFMTTMKTATTRHLIGRGLIIGGALVTGGGLIALRSAIGALAFTPLGKSVAIHSFLGGALYLGFNNDPFFTDDAGAVANEGTALNTGEKTYKMNLLNYKPTTPDTPPDPTKPSGKTVLVTDDPTKKVESSTFFPNKVINAMEDPSKVDFVNDAPSEPLDLTGTVTSKYNYTDNTVTTITQISPEETKTETFPMTVTQNPDGSVTSTPSPSSSAPTVSGSNGGSWDDTDWLNKISKNYDDTSKYYEDLATGKTPTNDLNSTKIDPLEKSGADIVSKLDQILNALTGGSAPSLTNGSDGFGDLDTQVKGAYSGFVYTDPLGLNALGGGSIPSYGFTLYGRHFVILDQAKLDALPLDVIRKLFLFVAAIAAFITVISGV